MYKVISFDIGGTLILNNSSDKYNLFNLAELLEISYNEVRIAYKDIFQKKSGSLDELNEQFSKKLNLVNKEISLNFFRSKFSCNDIKYNKDIVNMINKLSAVGYKVILFSNSCCLLDNKLDDKLKEKIYKIFYSFDIGYTKSDEESYRIIEKELGCLPNEILHIGDTLKSDYYEPIKNGWDALYFGETSDTNVKSIKDINDLFNYLGDSLWINESYLLKKKKD